MQVLPLPQTIPQPPQFDLSEYAFAPKLRGPTVDLATRTFAITGIALHPPLADHTARATVGFVRLQELAVVATGQ